MDHIHTYDRPKPDDKEPSHTDATVDDSLASRNADRSTDAPAGPTGEITNMEVQYNETSLDREETDPFGKSSGGES